MSRNRNDLPAPDYSFIRLAPIYVGGELRKPNQEQPEELKAKLLAEMLGEGSDRGAEDSAPEAPANAPDEWGDLR